MRFITPLILTSILLLAIPALAKEDPKKKKPKADSEKIEKPGKKTPETPAQKKEEPRVWATGYTDTPLLPGGKWRVHDDTRPRPEVVTPGERSSNAPSDAIVLFDGTNLDEWSMDADGSGCDWVMRNDYMEVPPKSESVGGSARTKREFSDFQLHIEFATPEVVEGNSQGRGNSGVFLLGAFEIQVLDSYNNKSYADGQASAIYGYKPPLVNACRPPGKWQTYDIIFEGPKWDSEGNLLKRAYVTVMHNGVLTHHRQDFLGPGGHKQVPNYNNVQESGPLKLQNHGNPTRFRNIWIRELDFNANN